MESHARVVIVGGGIMGVGLAYHLALEGWTDVVLLEKGELTSGSTWHAAGQCPHFIGSVGLAKVHAYGTRLYPQLEKLTGQAVSWHPCGGLRLALTDDEVDWFHRVAGVMRLAGAECEIIGPSEIPRYHRFLDVTGVKAAFRTIDDGHVAPADVTSAMAAGARAAGVAIRRRTCVTGIALLPSGEWRVSTETGDITCEHVVNAAGSYADVVAGWTGHRVPIANMLHHYLVTEPLQDLIDLAPELPVVRDPWSHAYLREEANGLLIGPYETKGAHACWNGAAPPWDFESELLAPELDRLTPWLERAAERLPLFAQAGVKSVVSGAITHTPDGVYLSGPAHGPRNYWMHCGASIGICQGAGAGKYLAQWMVHGQAEISMREFDPRRFNTWCDQATTEQVAVADYHHMYYCYRPDEQHAAGRNLRRSALHERLATAGARFGQVFGWERPRFFAMQAGEEEFSFRRGEAFAATRAEALAVREHAGLADLSSFAKYEVSGRDAGVFLERICAGRLPARDGAIVLTHLLDECGRIESEFTVTRLAADHYYLLSAAAAELHDLDQLRWRQAGEQITIDNVTDAYGAILLTGPRSRDVLSQFTSAALDNLAFPWLTAQPITVAGRSVRALRVSYAGELGWELHASPADLPVLFDALTTLPDGPRLIGTSALNSLRLEKAYPAWGSELTPEVDMIEASMTRFVRRTAIDAARQHSPRSRLVMLEVDATDADCLGSEPMLHNDTCVGLTTSGGYGFAVEKSLAFAYVPPPLATPGTEFQIPILGTPHAARILPNPPWDPTNTRLKDTGT